MTNDIGILISQLRELRAEERKLRSTLVDDLQRFQKKDRSFFTLPSSNRKGISVATTCTALMALIDSDKLSDLFPEEPASKLPEAPEAMQTIAVASPETSKAQVPVPPREVPNTPEATQLIAVTSPGIVEAEVPLSPKELFTELVKGSWGSSGLNDLNAFTTCMVVRAAGFLVSSQVLTPAEAKTLVHERPPVPTGRVGDIEKALGENQKPTLLEIIRAVGSGAHDTFAIPGYPPKTTMAYWFVDGITKAQCDVDKSAWKTVAEWAATEFDRQLSYVVSDNDPLMDPAALAMAACLISRLRRTFAESELLASLAKHLPSRVELMHAVEQVYGKQAESGIWHKYFPLFHFPGSGAADYCFSFEFLEAILIEFSDLEILANEKILAGIQKAVKWCNTNRFVYREGKEIFCGWNAGGEVRNLAEGVPEGWATGAVHMFLWELDSALSRWLDQLILSRFRVDRVGAEVSTDRWKGLIDVDLQLPGGHGLSLKKVLEDELIIDKTTIKPNLGFGDKTLSGRRSALLFGPPGTSKTTIAEVTAERLGWPLVVISPSHFLTLGLEKIYVRANEIFEDLMDISDAVVLFDEMDALVQTRGKPGKNEDVSGLDVTRLLLTTSMLPKLQDLHKRGRVIFLLATNHIRNLDPAITRPGRFDLLLCVGPPNWSQKLQGLAHIYKKLPAEQVGVMHTELARLAESNDTKQKLDRFTVADLKSFLDHLKGTERFDKALPKLQRGPFEDLVTEWAEKFITMNKDSGLFEEYTQDRGASRIQ
jgi:hypothetical protein